MLGGSTPAPGRVQNVAGWEWVACEHGKINVAARASGSQCLRAEAIQGDKVWDSFANVFGQRRVIHVTPDAAGAGYWFSPLLSIELEAPHISEDNFLIHQAKQFASSSILPVAVLLLSRKVRQLL